ncbi:MAG TPA: nuclear transport factor 2 family protein [Candidatus Koribacter sp.]|jgi:hypothetical protein
MRPILCSALIVALFLTTACTVAPESAKPNWSMATSGEQYERLFWDALKAKDWRNVEMHLSGTVVSEGPEGVANKQQLMEHLRKFDVTDYSLGEVQTETAGGDIIVTYSITVHGTIDGKPLPTTPFRMMSVWQQVKKGMVLAAHTTMPAA